MGLVVSATNYSGTLAAGTSTLKNVSYSRAKKKLALLFTQKLSQTALEQVEYIFGNENIHGEP